MDVIIDSKALGRVCNGVKSVVDKDTPEAIITARENGWLIMMKGMENVTMFACKVPPSAMESYSIEEDRLIGVPVDKLESVASSASGAVDLTLDEHRFIVSNETYTRRFRGIDPQYVNGYMENTINVDWEVNISSHVEKIMDFVSTCSRDIESDSFVVSAREDGMLLYSSKDDDEIHSMIRWDDFEEHSVDFNVAGISSMSELHAESVFSVGFFNEFNFPTGDDVEYTLDMGDDKPMRVIAKCEGGVNMSFVITPRITDSDDSSADIPQSVIESY